ncbi:MAG: hypothetical protein J6A98_02850 [Clostridia bacterium]|nr:hypothetical protein [Clostridia bacterium]
MEQNVIITGQVANYHTSEKVEDFILHKTAVVGKIEGLKEVAGNAMLTGVIKDLSSLEKVQGNLLITGQVGDLSNLKFVGGDLIIHFTGKVEKIGQVDVKGNKLILGSIGVMKDDDMTR